jgi:UDPglucose 6-dehydrogenase
MKIGIVGLGIVGNASKFGFEKLGHTVSVHDIRLHTTINDVVESEVVFVSVPTPSKEDGSCDTSIVESVIEELVSKYYRGIIAIRSTVTPGTTQRLIDKYKNSIEGQICFVPEFLRERCAIVDFVENNNLLAVGTKKEWVYETVKSCFGHYPKTHAHLSPTEAELLKYYHNTIGALRVVFANEFYEICKSLGANYTFVKNALLQSAKLPDIYLDANENMRGYSSVCWNKDVPAICQLAKNLGLDLPLMFTIEPANDRFKKTPFEGTREHY